MENDAPTAAVAATSGKAENLPGAAVSSAPRHPPLSIGAGGSPGSLG